VIEHLGRGHSLYQHIGDFLTYPSNAAASRQTIRTYRGDLLHFAAHHDDEIGELTTGR
jgi:integrase/recombinase XerC/integrase/recombinase XerD